MIFKDKLQEKRRIIRPEFDRLIDIAIKNQYHTGDLLLFHINGFYHEDTLIWNQNHPDNLLNPHVFGPSSEGHSEQTHFSFIHKYRTTHIHSMAHSEYIRQFEMEKWNEELNRKNDELIEIEETTIQLEMLIYLKFWESDMIIKKLYQLARLLNGENYDWYFRISESNRDKTSTGTRQNIIRKMINDKIQPHSDSVYQIIKATYRTQIRNSIAHSNYSFLGRNINLNNFIEGDPYASIYSLTFDEWIDMFHNTIVLHNEYVRMGNLINDYYSRFASENNNTVEILVTEQNGTEYPLCIEYRPGWKDWTFKQNK